MYSAALINRVIFLVFSTFLLASCGGGSADQPSQVELAVSPNNPLAQPQSAGQNSAPIARIGGQYEILPVRTGDTVQLSGSASYDPDGDPLTYQWTLVAKPARSLAFLNDDAAETTEFVADVDGDYSVELVVSDSTSYSDPANVTISVIDFTPMKLNWGMHKDYGNGEDPDVAINNHGIIVQVFESPKELSTVLYYRVGVARGGLVGWGDRKKLGDDADDDGLFPSVDINDAGTVVAIWGNWDLTYRVGVVDTDSKTIDFGSTKEDFESGVQASIAINNNGQVIEVHRSRGCTPLGTFGCQLLYRVGTVNVSNRSISFGSERDNLSKGRRPAVDLNDNNEVIIVREHSSTGDQSLYYQTARLNPGAKTLSRRESGEYDHGAYPDVAINNAGRIVEVHKSQGKDTLWSAAGWLQDNGRPALGNARPYSVGIATSVGMNDLDTFIAVNDTRIDNLFYQFSRDFPAPKNTDRWMELTRTMHRKTLRYVTLPGTHDSGAYELFTTVDGDPYAARAPDMTVIEIIDILGTICDLPLPGLYTNWLGWLCKAWVPTPVEFNENGHDIALTQSRSIGKQLDDGIRVFDLDITKRDGRFHMYHGLLGNKLDIALAEIREFVERTSAEVVVLEFNSLKIGSNKDDKRDFSREEHEELMEMIVASLGDRMAKQAGPDESENLRELLDTQLRDLTEDGSLVIAVLACELDDCNSANLEFSEYFWGLEWASLYWAGQETTTDLELQESGIYTDYETWLTDHRDRLFKQIQTLTASAEPFKDAVRDGNEIITGQVFFRRIVFQDYWPSLHKLSQDANHHLSHQLSKFLQSETGTAPNAITTDFYEESDVVKRSIELSARCNEAAITGAIDVDSPNLWPPNHKMVEVKVDVSGLQSANPDSFGAKITDVEIFESDRKSGENIYLPNNFEPDYEVVDDLSVLLRSERDGQADERQYVLEITAWDCSGDYEFKTPVRVSHDQSD